MKQNGVPADAWAVGPCPSTASWVLAIASLMFGCGAAQHQQPETRGGATSPQASGARDVPVDPAPVQPSATATREGATNAGVPAGSLARSEVDRALARGPGWLLNQLPLEPVVAAGRRFLGFRLMQVFDDSPRAHSYGIRPGDIVQSINGIRLIRPEDLMRIVEKLRKANAIEARILRDGEPRTHRIPIVDDPDLGGRAAPSEAGP